MLVLFVGVRGLFAGVFRHLSVVSGLFSSLSGLFYMSHVECESCNKLQSESCNKLQDSKVLQRAKLTND